MSGRRRRSDSLWDRKEEMEPQTETNEKIPWQDKELHSSLQRDDRSPKRSNSEANDTLVSGDFPGPPMQGNENMPTDNDNSRDRHRMNTDPAFDEWENQYTSRPSDDSYGLPYRAGGTGNMSRDRGRSRSPNRNESRGRDRRSRSRSRGRGRSPLNRVEKRSGRGEYSGDDRNRKDYHRDRDRDRDRGNRNAMDDQDHRRRQSTQTSSSSRAPCKFFSLGKCNRNNCKFSHDNIQIQAHNSGNNIMPQGPQWNNVESASFDENIPGNTMNQSEKNAQMQQVMPPEANATIAAVVPGNSYFQQKQQQQGQSNVAMMIDNSEQIPPYRQDFIQQGSMNGSGQDMFLHQGGKPLETWKNDIPPVPVSLPQIANALELLYASSAAESIKPSLPSQQENQMSSISTDAKQEPPGNLEGNEKRMDENPGKSDAQGKVEESNISNDEKAMRQFKIALVEFVKEILKPTWKEGKMSREVYKTIVKKVVDKVTSTIQGIQIPKTQEKIDQYLAFSKSKITKLVEAYVGRFLKA